MNRVFPAVVCVVWACSPAATTDRSPPNDGELTTDAIVAEQAAAVDSVRRAYTQADVDFMAGMIHHHAQALVMSRMAPSHGASPSLQIMARRIINAQNDEIDLMQAWLRDRGEAVPEPRVNGDHPSDDDHAMHADHDASHEMMPGMLTDDQMAALDAARGEEFDRLYLQFMIQHHQGAVTMVNELVAVPGAAREEAVFKLASDIGADQASEITRMQTMLRDLLFSSDPP
ncbi:MAG TPA: DUF305 domain-containing protein [Gemmatimonadota bacterium]|nr:DUF305 domain-containing protein [Gemmatimonadota bacterium]